MRLRQKDLVAYLHFKRVQAPSDYVGTESTYELYQEILGELYSAQITHGVAEFGEKASKMAYLLSMSKLSLGDGIGLLGADTPCFVITGVAPFSGWIQYTLESLL